jgi:DNA processing protein
MTLIESGGVGPKTFQQLLLRLGPPENVLSAGPEDLEDIPRISEDGPEKILKSLNRIGEFEQKIEEFDSQGINTTTFLDDDYPELLREIGDPPPIIYSKGNLKALKLNYVALVGTTQATQAGLRLTVDLAKELINRGVGVISGLASGIDSAAHLSALKNQGSTIAVLGCGFFNIYPPENITLAENIAATGLLISEYPPQRRVKAARLILRNRLISAFSRAVVVTQVGIERRGELRTAQYAYKQGKPLFLADPDGILDNETIKSSNALLINGVEAVDDIIKYMA